MTKLQRIEEMEKQLEALKTDAGIDNGGFTLEKWNNKMEELKMYHGWILNDVILNDGIPVDEIVFDDPCCNTEYTVNMGKLAKIIESIAFFKIGFDGFPLGIAFRTSEYSLNDLWDKVKDLKELN